MKKIMSLLSKLIFVIGISIQSCNPIEKNEYIIQVNKSPYCIYKFVYRNNEKIDAISLYWDYNLNPDTENFDTVIQVVTIDKSKLEELNFLINNIEKKQQSDFKIYERPDAFTFSLYKNGKIISKVWGYDENIQKILTTISPFIKQEELICDDFFDLFNESVRMEETNKNN